MNSKDRKIENNIGGNANGISRRSSKTGDGCMDIWIDRPRISYRLALIGSACC